MKRRFLKPLAGAALGLPVISVMAFAILQPIQVLPRIRLAPGFALVNQGGQRLTSEDLRGQIVLYNFTYTRCQLPCPQSSPTMQEVQNRLDELDLGEIPVRLVTISFDPEHDTPGVLSAYARQVGAKPERWYFATGDPTGLKYALGASFEVYYVPDATGGFEFDPVFVLVDGWGVIRAEYRYQTVAPDVDRMLRHIGVVAEEANKSKGTARLAYEAAHLFLCYAP